MARIYKKTNALEKKRLLTGGLSLAGFALFFVGIAVALFARWFVFVPVGFAGLLLGMVMNQKYNIYKAGISGEAATARLLQTLPEDYFGVQNLKVTWNGEESELDMVVVGPTGVFVVETKNQKGTVIGDTEEKNWILQKVGRKGGAYSKTFYNPVKQVGTHVYRLANFLRSNGTNVRVESAVYFSNPVTVVQLTGVPKNAEVFCASDNGVEKLTGYIRNREAKLSPVQLSRIKQLLGC